MSAAATSACNGALAKCLHEIRGLMRFWPDIKSSGSFVGIGDFASDICHIAEANFARVEQILSAPVDSETEMLLDEWDRWVDLHYDNFRDRYDTYLGY